MGLLLNSILGFYFVPLTIESKNKLNGLSCNNQLNPIGHYFFQTHSVCVLDQPLNCSCLVKNACP